MAFAAFTRTLPTPVATLSGFVCLLNEAWWTQANANAMDGTTFINGGGSIRCYTDSSKTTQLPVEVVSFVTGGTPSAQVWVRVPNYTSASTTIYVESDAVATSQPIATDTYGRNAVWQDYALVNHGGKLEDSSGNELDGVITGTVNTISDSYGWGEAHNFNHDASYISFGTLNTNVSSLQAIIKLDNSPTTNEGVMGSLDLSNVSTMVIADNVAFITSNPNTFDVSFNNTSTRRDSGSNTALGGSTYNFAAINGDGIYIDGVIKNTIPTTTFSTGTTFRIGALAGYPSIAIDGSVAEVRARKSTSTALNSDWLSTENTMLQNPGGFGTSSGWTTGGTTGVTGDVAFSVSKPLFNSSGTATLPAPSGDVSFTIGKTVFNSTGSATLPQPSGSISFDANKPSFSGSGSATLPYPQGIVAFTISKPQFSATGSSTQPNPTGNISFTVNKPVFNAVGSATLPNPTGAVDFTVNNPTFSATGSAGLPYPQGAIAFNIDKPVLSGSGSATLPSPSGTIDFTINKPVFSAFGTASGLSLIAADDATIKLTAESNTIKLQAASNTIKL